MVFLSLYYLLFSCSSGLTPQVLLLKPVSNNRINLIFILEHLNCRPQRNLRRSWRRMLNLQQSLLTRKLLQTMKTSKKLKPRKCRAWRRVLEFRDILMFLVGICCSCLFPCVKKTYIFWVTFDEFFSFLFLFLGFGLCIRRI